MTAGAKHGLALWASLLTGPIVWFLNLEAKFALAPWVCSFQWKPAVLLISLVSIAITIVSAWPAWIEWRRINGRINDGTAAPVTFERVRAMALAGIALSASFVLVLIAQAIPELMMQGCE